MSAVATREPRARQQQQEHDSARRPAKRLFEPNEATLEDVILAAWDGLKADDPSACPVCGRDRLDGGGCRDCGSQLS
jgi:hypothetical protein